MQIGLRFKSPEKQGKFTTFSYGLYIGLEFPEVHPLSGILGTKLFHIYS